MFYKDAQVYMKSILKQKRERETNICKETIKMFIFRGHNENLNPKEIFNRFISL